MQHHAVLQSAKISSGDSGELTNHTSTESASSGFDLFLVNTRESSLRPAPLISALPIYALFAGLCFITWWLTDRLHPFDGSGHPWRLAAAVMPALAAVAVGITRYADYWHHPTDIVAGGLGGCNRGCGGLVWLRHHSGRQWDQQR